MPPSLTRTRLPKLREVSSCLVTSFSVLLPYSIRRRAKRQGESDVRRSLRDEWRKCQLFQCSLNLSGTMVRPLVVKFRLVMNKFRSPSYIELHFRLFAALKEDALLIHRNNYLSLKAGYHVVMFADLIWFNFHISANTFSRIGHALKCFIRVSNYHCYFPVEICSMLSTRCCLI